MDSEGCAHMLMSLYRSTCNNNSQMKTEYQFERKWGQWEGLEGGERNGNDVLIFYLETSCFDLSLDGRNR